MREYRLGHVRVANDVVRAADQVLAGEAADRHELVIAVGDHALGIGRGDQPLAGREADFVLGDGLVVFQARASMRLVCSARWVQSGSGLIIDAMQLSGRRLGDIKYQGSRLWR